MACWVVPAIAAELWGVTVNHVLARIRDGSVTAREEYGFVFVDAAPGSHTYRRPRPPGEPPPATYVRVERSVFAPEPPNDIVGPEEQRPPLEPVTSGGGAEEDELPPLDEEEDDKPLPPRDAIRAAVARQRRRPLAA